MYHQNHIPTNQSVIATLILTGVLVMAIGLGLMMAMPVHAAGTVSTCNEANVNTALTGGGTITFTCSGTITLTTVKSITANTIIDGAGQTVTLTASVGSVFTIGSGQSLSFKNLTLTLSGNNPINMTGGGSLTLDTVTIQNGAPSVYGVIMVSHPTLPSYVTFTNSQFRNNIASGSSSGGMTVQGATGSTLTINGCVFDTNWGSGNYAGTLVLQGATAVTISNSQFLNNKDASNGPYGGAIGWAGTNSLNITGSTFRNNTTGNGGAIYIMNSGTVTIDGSTFNSNTAGSHGGAIYLGGGALTITNSTFSSNRATEAAGAILINSGTTGTINTSTFDGNRASYTGAGGDGGAILNSGTLTINDSTFTNNRTWIDNYGQNGGALNASGAASMTTINRSTFSGNSATHGGAIFVWGGNSFSLSNSTITGNTAGNASTSGVSVGGGISLSSGLTTATIKNVTVANNTVSGSGGGGLHSNTTTTLNLYNSILANNTGSSGNLDCYLQSGTLSVNTNNLIMNGNCGTPAVTANPLLGTLANNGGTTQTRALLAGSPALEAGDDGSCLSTAQNGVTRPRAAHCDIGAYEMPLYTLTLAKNGTGTGTVSSSGTPVGTSCGTDCLTYLDTTAITLTTTADPGSVFTGWSPATCVTGMTLTANTTCTATFMPGHNLTLATDGTGTGTGTVSSSGTPAGISCGANCLTYLNTTAITLTATPGNNSTFAGWSPATCVTGMTINADTTCTATFNLVPPVTPPPPPPLPEYLGLFLRLEGTGSGKVTTDTGLSCHRSDCQKQIDGSLLCNPPTCSQPVKTASTVTLTPQADLGSYFSSWGGHQDCLTSPMLMDSGKLCIAYFHLSDEPLTVVIQGQGSVTATPLNCPGTCTATYPYGTTVTLQTQPATGWQFQAWSGDCDKNGQVLMTNTKNCGATFMPNVDSDLDHITSTIEDAAPNHGDGNGDGIPDSQQNNVSSFVDAVNSVYLTLQVDKTCPITNVYGELPDNYAGVNSNHHFLQGLTYFELSCAQTQVTMYYHRVSKLYRNLRFYKYGPTVPGDMKTVGWYKYPATFAVVTIGGLPVMMTTYTLTDGQWGDSTGVDGKIVDPGGLEYH